MYTNHALPRRPIVTSNNLVQQDVDCSKEWEEQKARLKVFIAEVVSLRFVSYSEAKAATYAQEGGYGATSEGRAKDVSNHEEGVAAKTSYFNINLIKSKLWLIIVYRS